MHRTLNTKENNFEQGKYTESLLTINDTLIEYSRAETNAEKEGRHRQFIVAMFEHNAKFPNNGVRFVKEREILTPYKGIL